jgi:hypothetical protein
MCAVAISRLFLLIGDATFTLLSGGSCIPTDPRPGLAMHRQTAMMQGRLFAVKTA